MHYLYLGLAIIAETIATSVLKSTAGFTKPLPTVIVFMGYMVAFYLLSIIVQTLPVGVVYAIWSGVGIVLVSLAGLVFMKQRLDFAAMAGIGLILAGVVVINLWSRTVMR